MLVQPVEVMSTIPLPQAQGPLAGLNV